MSLLTLCLYVPFTQEPSCKGLPSRKFYAEKNPYVPSDPYVIMYPSNPKPYPQKIKPAAIRPNHSRLLFYY